MNQLFRLKDNIVQFLSPPSKRRRTLPATPFQQKEHQVLTPDSDLVDQKAKIAAQSRLNKAYDVAPENRTSRKRAREDDDEDDFAFGIHPNDSISQIEAQEESGSSGDSEGGFENEEEMEEIDDLGEDDEVTGQDKVAEWQARQAELAVRLGNIEKARSADSHPDAFFLTQRIQLRSFEEIMPSLWQIDFPALPVDLFTDDVDKQFINSNNISSYAGVRALQSLLSLGERVQAVQQNNGLTERCITREIKAYIKWSERDGGYYNRRFLPVLVVVSAKPGQSTTQLGDNLMSQFRFLAKQHREFLANPMTGAADEVPSFRRPPPLLYGMLIVQTLVVLFTYDSSRERPDLMKTFAFNFNGEDRSQEVWDCIGIASMVICARNYLMSIKDDFEIEEEEVDPDL